MKACAHCRLEKPTSDFYSAKSSYCKPCHLSRQKIWDTANHDRKLEYNRQWRVRNRPRRKIMQDAGNALWNAIRKGSIKRASHCSKCQSPENIEAAHLDYNKPLHVIWLCRICHRNFDSKNPKSRNI